MFDKRQKFFTIFWVAIMSLCGCAKTFNVNAKQSNYKIVKASLGETGCVMSKINIQERQDGVFIANNDFTLLANNINNFNICYANLLEKSKTNLAYYEDIIKTLGGEFEL